MLQALYCTHQTPFAYVVRDEQRQKTEKKARQTGQEMCAISSRYHPFLSNVMVREHVFDSLRQISGQLINGGMVHGATSPRALILKEC